MKTIPTVILVVGSCLVTFVISVFFSMNMVVIKPEELAKVLKEDPMTFMEAFRETVEKYQAETNKQAFEKQFKNPAKIPTEGRVTFGTASAPVTIVKYSDFQCTYCARAAKRMKMIREKYDGKVNLVYKHFPLSFHPFAKPAAEYFESIAMADHSKAREFHDMIFENFSDYARLKDEKEINQSLDKIIKKIGLSKTIIEKNIDKAKEIVNQDIAEANKLKVGGTPTFFINGVNPQGRFEATIDKLLEDL